MTKNCINCAWFCHADGKCYGVEGVPQGYPTVPNGCECSTWTFDGLKDEEREELDALVTMETVK